MNDPSMIPCDHVIAQLWEYIDGELTEDQAAQVQAHLESCNRCFPQYDFQRAYRIFLRRTAQQPIPPGLRRRVFETILAEEAGSGESVELPPDGGSLLGSLRTLLDRFFQPR